MYRGNFRHGVHGNNPLHQRERERGRESYPFSVNSIENIYEGMKLLKA